MKNTPQRSMIDQYRRTLDQRMIELAALGLTEDFYVIPLRKTGMQGMWLAGEIPLVQPGRRLRLELRIDRNCPAERRIVAKLSGLYGLGLSGKRCETVLNKDARRTFAGVFDFDKIALGIRVMSYASPHTVDAIATLEQVLPDDRLTGPSAADEPAPCSPSY
jgi:hypothetical protein